MALKKRARQPPEHFDEHCAGEWSVVPDDKNEPAIVCYECGASHAAVNNKLVEDALHQNWMGGLLKILANQGQALDDDD